MLLTASLAVAACGVASASSIDYLSTPTTYGPFDTDFSYSLSLPKFNLPGETLTGATIYFFAEETVSTLTLTNTASGVESFTFQATSNATSNSTNSANSADAYSAETITLFNETMTLGGNSEPACPESTPSNACSSVSFTPPPLSANNLTLGFPTGTGGLGLTGVVKSIIGLDLANYVGATDFTLGGSTKSFTSFSGGGNNVSPAIDTSAQMSAEIDYTYQPTGTITPEPVSMGLFGGGLLGLGFLAKRRRKS
jgi:hypothetical protein